jgi:Flp pilus assembly protein TadD
MLSLANSTRLNSVSSGSSTLRQRCDEGYLNMGLLLELKGESSRALSFFEKAVSLNPNNAKAKEHIGKLKTPLP